MLYEKKKYIKQIYFTTSHEQLFWFLISDSYMDQQDIPSIANISDVIEGEFLKDFTGMFY